MADICLICGEEKTASMLKCKMCGMGIDRKIYVSSGFEFCSAWCVKKFHDIYSVSTPKERIELIERNIII